MPGFPAEWAVEELRAARLAAYAYVASPPESPEREALRADWAAVVFRHAKTRREVVPLLRAWWEAGIEVLLFKGFALSEFVYPAPGVRAYGDVDVLVRPEDAPRALAVAHSLGWWDRTHLERDGISSHTVFDLVGPDGGAEVDVHRWALHSTVPWNRAQRRITRAVWERSVERTLDGVPVRLPAPVDAVVVGLILQRCWGDRWRLRPDHRVDLRLLREREGVTPEMIRERARELRCAETVEAFLREHEADGGAATPAAPDAEVLRVRRRAILRERGDLAFWIWLLRAHLAGHAVLSIPTLVRTTLALRRVRRVLRATTDPAEALPRLTPAPRPLPRTGTAPAGWGEHALRWAMRLVRPAPHDPEMVRVLALYTLLRRQGWPVVYRSTAGDAPLDGRAATWIELDGRVLAVSGSFAGTRRTRATFTHPEPAPSA